MPPGPSLSMTGIIPDTGVVVSSVEVGNVDERVVDSAGAEFVVADSSVEVKPVSS